MNYRKIMIGFFVICAMLMAPLFAFAAPEATKISSLGVHSEAVNPAGEYVVYVSKDNEWQEAGKLLFDKYFRSTPQIIHTVNQVFTKLWGSEYKPSEADRKQHQGSVLLIELLPTSSEEGPAFPTEAEILAREIKLLIEKRIPVHEKTMDPRMPGNDGTMGTDWKERPAGYGDCAVLIQSRTKLKEYEAALQAEGVPFRVVGGIGFYEEDEIQAVLNVLFFLWNRDDKLALAAALKSPLVGMTDKDIFDLLQDGGDMVDSLRDHRSDAAEALDSLASLISLVRWTALSGLDLPPARTG